MSVRGKEDLHDFNVVLANHILQLFGAECHHHHFFALLLRRQFDDLLTAIERLAVPVERIRESQGQFIGGVGGV